MTDKEFIDGAHYNGPADVIEFSAREMMMYGKTQAIKFAKWLNQNGWTEYDEPDRWICQVNSNQVYTTARVYEMFEKEVK